MLHRIMVGAAALSFAFMALIGGADAAPKKTPTVKNKPAAAAPAPTGPVTDQSFVTRAQQGNDMEIELGNMILQQGISGHLRDLGLVIVKDHTMLKNELAKIAKGAKFTLPGGIDPNMVPMRDSLKKKSGIAFDKAMWPVLIKGHQQAVALYKAEIASGRNKELVAWAKQRLPMIQHHLAMAMKDQAAPTDNGTTKPQK